MQRYEAIISKPRWRVLHLSYYPPVLYPIYFPSLQHDSYRWAQIQGTPDIFYLRSSMSHCGAHPQNFNPPAESKYLLQFFSQRRGFHYIDVFIATVHAQKILPNVPPLICVFLDQFFQTHLGYQYCQEFQETQLLT